MTQDKPCIAIFDESSKMFGAIKALFVEEYEVLAMDPAHVPTEIKEADCLPQIILYISKGNIDLAGKRIRLLRKKWEKAIVVLLLPSTNDENQLKAVSDVSAHHVLFRPCTRKKLLDVVNHYRYLLEGRDVHEGARANALFSALMEFVGSKRPDIYVAFNRVSPLITSMCQKVGFDWRRVHEVFTILMLVLANIDEMLVHSLMDGEGRKAKKIKGLYSEISKMVDLLALNASTGDMSQDLNYVLKRYDGEGMPEDDVSGQEIPAAARIIRLLLDYNYLLQAGKTSGEALFIISKREGWYDDVLVHVLAEVIGDEGRRYTRDVYPLGLVPGMVVAEDVYGMIDGKRRKIMSSNEILTEKIVDYLQRHSEDILDITEPVKIVEELFSKEEDDNA